MVYDRYTKLEDLPTSVFSSSTFTTFAALTETLPDTLSDAQVALQAGLASNIVNGESAFSELATDAKSAHAIYDFITANLSDFDFQAARATSQYNVWLDVIKDSPVYSGSKFSFRAFGQSGDKGDSDTLITQLYETSGTNLGLTGQNPFRDMRLFLQAAKTAVASNDTDFATTSLCGVLSNMTLSTKLSTQTEATICRTIAKIKLFATFLKDAFTNLVDNAASRTLNSDSAAVTGARIATFVGTYTLSSGTSIYSTAGADDTANTTNDQALIIAILQTMMGGTDLADVGTTEHAANMAKIQLAFNQIFDDEVAITLDTDGTDANTDIAIPASPINGTNAQATDLDLIAVAIDSFARILSMRNIASQAASNSTSTFFSGFVSFMDKNGASAQLSNPSYVDIDEYKSDGVLTGLKSWWAWNAGRAGSTVDSAATATDAYGARFSSTAALLVGGGNVFSPGSAVSAYNANVVRLIEDESNGTTAAATGEVSMTFAGLSSAQQSIRNQLVNVPVLQNAFTDNPTNNGKGWTIGAIANALTAYTDVIERKTFDFVAPEFDYSVALGATRTDGPKLSVLLSDSSTVLQLNPVYNVGTVSNADLALSASLALAMMAWDWISPMRIIDGTSDVLFANTATYSSFVGSANEKNSTGSTITFNTDGVASALDVAAENTVGGSLTSSEEIKFTYLLRQIEGSLNKDSTYDQLETTLGTLLGAAANLDAVAKASLWMALMQVGETDGVGSITGRLIAEQNYTTLATYLTRNGTQASILTAQPNDQTGVNSSQDGTVLQLNSIWKFKVKFGGEVLPFPAWVIRESNAPGFPTSTAVTYIIQTLSTDTPTTITGATALEAVYKLYESKSSTGFAVIANSADFANLITRGGALDPSVSTDMTAIRTALVLYFGATNKFGTKNFAESYTQMTGLIDYIYNNKNLSYFKLSKDYDDVWKDLQAGFITAGDSFLRSTNYAQPTKDKNLDQATRIKFWLINTIEPDTGNEGEKIDTNCKNEYLTFLGETLDFNPKTRAIQTINGSVNTASNGTRFKKTTFALTGTAATDYALGMKDRNHSDELETVWKAIPEPVKRAGLTKLDLALSFMGYVGTAPGDDTAAQEVNRTKLAKSIMTFADLNELRAEAQGGLGYWYKKDQLLSIISTAHSSWVNFTTNVAVTATDGSPTTFGLTSPSIDYTDGDDSTSVITEVAVKFIQPLVATTASDQEFFSKVSMDKLSLASERELLFKSFTSATLRSAYLSLDAVSINKAGMKVLDYFIKQKLKTSDDKLSLVVDVIEKADQSSTAATQTTLTSKVDKMNNTVSADNQLDTLAENFGVIWSSLSNADKKTAADAALARNSLGSLGLIMKSTQDGPGGHSENAIKEAIQLIGIKNAVLVTHYINSRSSNTVFFDTNGSTFEGVKATYVAYGNSQNKYVYLDTYGQLKELKLEL